MIGTSRLSIFLGLGQDMVFDGTHIWVSDLLVASRSSDTAGEIDKIRVSDGRLVGTYSVGPKPFGLAFDGSYVWVATRGDDTVSRLRPSDGTIVGSYPVQGASEILFDGEHIWAYSPGVGDTLSKLCTA